MQDNVPIRIVIYAKDISNITGKKERTARKILARIRRNYNKKPGHLITIKEFCDFTGIEENQIRKFLL